MDRAQLVRITSPSSCCGWHHGAKMELSIITQRRPALQLEKTTLKGLQTLLLYYIYTFVSSLNFINKKLLQKNYHSLPKWIQSYQIKAAYKVRHYITLFNNWYYWLGQTNKWVYSLSGCCNRLSGGSTPICCR